MALGDGTHKLPVKADIRRAVGKEAGATVRVRLTERLDGWTEAQRPEPWEKRRRRRSAPRGRVRRR